MAVLLCSNVPAGGIVPAHLCEYGFLLYVIHGHDGICSGMRISGWYKSPQQSVDERWYYSVSFLQKKENGGYFYDWKNMLKYGCLIAGVVLAGIGWWFIRSYIVLDGDLLGLATREKMAIQYAVESVNPLTMQTYQSMGYTVLEMFRERYTLSGLFHSFVAAFGSMSIYGSIGVSGVFVA